MFLHIVLVNDHGPFEWQHLKREGLTVVQRIALTEYIQPKPATFNLLEENEVLSRLIIHVMMCLKIYN